MPFLQGQWVKAELGSYVDVARADGGRRAVLAESLPELLHRSGPFLVGVWYPRGKQFVGLGGPERKPLTFATFWPVDAAQGMPLEWEGARLAFAADSLLTLAKCDLADLPPERAKLLTEDQVRRFVEGVDG